MRANYWVAQQVMAAGVHGILLCHAENPEAVKIFVESLRYPFAEKHAGLDTGIRGNGSQGFASQIWGLPANEYMLKADMWPLNKNGEVLLGLKIETPMAAENCGEDDEDPRYRICRVGTRRSEFLSRRSSYRLRPRRRRRESHPAMKKVRARIFKAAKAANLFFLNSCNEQNVIDMIKEGVMICTGGDTPAAEKGRQFTQTSGERGRRVIVRNPSALLLLAALPAAVSGQVNTLTREQMMKYTAQNPYGRFEDGRPKVPDEILEKLKSMSAEEVLGIARRGYANQYADGFKILSPGKVMVGRAMTLQLMPSRPDIGDVDQKEWTAKKQGRLSHQTALDMLQKGDVFVVDAFGNSNAGGIVGDNLAYYVWKTTGVAL